MRRSQSIRFQNDSALCAVQLGKSSIIRPPDTCSASSMQIELIQAILFWCSVPDTSYHFTVASPYSDWNRHFAITRSVSWIRLLSVIFCMDFSCFQFTLVALVIWSWVKCWLESIRSLLIPYAICKSMKFSIEMCLCLCFHFDFKIFVVRMASLLAYQIHNSLGLFFHLCVVARSY